MDCINAKELLKALRPLLAELRDDLIERAQLPGVREGLRKSYTKEKNAQRTADPFDLWYRARATQVAAAWVLSVIFVRTLEDRDLIDRRRIAGPGAEDSQEQFTTLAPFLSARDYLLAVFRELSRLPGVEGIFDTRHNPVWVLGPSGQVAARIVEFFRQKDEAGSLRWSFGGTETRFLGDLYQDLDEGVRKRYALLQTPDFIESFILDETLTPAIQTFGLAEVKLIDPTCGSGHFLLGAFHRLFAHWQDEEPGTDKRVLAQRALAQVYGADLNPYAVAIARFRLTLAFLSEAGFSRVAKAPPLPLNVCVADSLLHGK
ncbi:MAG: SAM-dependent methyltransferase, partial [Deltaproteobacteria bacterium]|nr:SAM-dependent methyltransferase [Deltaproteobacteria bacterium]